MVTKVLFWILSAVYFAIAERQPFINGGLTKVDNSQLKEVSLTGGGLEWNLFYFTNVGVASSNSYGVLLNVPAILEVTDMYCIGDIFAIMNGDTLLAYTSNVTVQSNCPTSTFDPDFAFYSTMWSSVSTLLLPGFYSIRIVPVSSPFTAGTGALRLVPVALSP